jgi:hypothetical protein
MDIKITKDSSLLLRVIHSLFYWRILKKIIIEKSAKQKKLVSVHE